MSCAGWTDPAVEPIARWLQEHTGLSFAPNRRADVEASIRRVLGKFGVADVGALLARLHSGALPLDDLIADLTVGETYFFRDPAQFDYIRRDLLPDLRRRHGFGHPLRAWSAGCASGEEAYSLAMLFEEEAVGEKATILATDISRAALGRARAASYGAWSLRGDNGALANRYFHRKGDRYVLDVRLHRRVSFDYLNLARDQYPSLVRGAWGMDLILCRNVLIYFDRDTIRRVMRHLIDTLKEGGVLITGASDPPYAEDGPYETVVTSAGVFYRRTAASAAAGIPRPVLPPLEEWPMPPNAIASQTAAAQAAGDDGATPGVTADPFAAAHEAAARGDHARVVDLIPASNADPAAWSLRIQALANLGETEAAECAAADAILEHPLSAELRFLHAMLLIGLDRFDEAAGALRQVIYLDRTLVAAHLALGSVLQRLGDPRGARRSYRIGHDLAAACAPDEPVPLSDHETAERLAAAARAQLALLAPAL